MYEEINIFLNIFWSEKIYLIVTKWNAKCFKIVSLESFFVCKGNGSLDHCRLLLEVKSVLLMVVWIIIGCYWKLSQYYLFFYLSKRCWHLFFHSLEKHWWNPSLSIDSVEYRWLDWIVFQVPFYGKASIFHQILIFRTGQDSTGSDALLQSLYMQALLTLLVTGPLPRWGLALSQH